MKAAQRPAQHARAPKQRPPKLPNSLTGEGNNEDASVLVVPKGPYGTSDLPPVPSKASGSSIPKATASTNSSEDQAKSGSTPVVGMVGACPACKALAIKMKAMEKRIALLEMIKIRATTISGQEFQMRVLSTDYVHVIKETAEKVLAVEHVHLYHRDSWLDPALTLGSFYPNRDMDISVIVTKAPNEVGSIDLPDSDQTSLEQPTEGINQHLAWQPTRQDNSYWDGEDTPVILDTDPKNLPQSTTEAWFFEQSYFSQQGQGPSSSGS